MPSEVVSFQAEKLVNGECYKFYWLRNHKCVLIYINHMEKGYTSHTRTQKDTIFDIAEFYNFVNNYQGTVWGNDGKTPNR